MNLGILVLLSSNEADRRSNTMVFVFPIKNRIDVTSRKSLSNPLFPEQLTVFALTEGIRPRSTEIRSEGSNTALSISDIPVGIERDGSNSRRSAAILFLVFVLIG